MNTTLTASEMTRGQKGVFEDNFGHWLRKKNFAGDEAQCIQGKWDKILESLDAASKNILVKYLYAGEEVASNYTYPKEYKRKSIREQIEILLEYFPGLNATWALTRGQVWYNGLKNLPEWVEGPLVYVWREAFSNYNAAAEQVLSAVGKKHENFVNYCSGRIGPEYLRQAEKTAGIEGKIKEAQPGDFIIVPSQAGLRWRGKSVRRGKVLYERNEFGLGSVAEGCRALTHDRFVRWEQLHTDCAGDEFSSEADGAFSGAPGFRFRDGEVGFGTCWVSSARGLYGSASGFVSQ